MGVFTDLLQKVGDEITNWHYIAYDQLHEGLLPDFDSKTKGLLFIETKWKARRLPYHKQKLALLLSNQRHFALEMQEKITFLFLAHLTPEINDDPLPKFFE